MPIYLGLGTNIGNREKNLSETLQVLADHPEIELKQTSTIFETEPKYDTEQDWFLNMVAEVETTLEPTKLLTVLKIIEKEIGRDFSVHRYGPRKIDIDILFVNDRIFDTENLKIPHPLINERKFVLEPLNQIAADFICPVNKKPVKKLLRMCRDEGVIRDLAKRVDPR